MRSRNQSQVLSAFAAAICAVVLGFALANPEAALANTQTSGSLTIIDKEGKIAGTCPLKHTEVKAEISGFIARVDVKQQFENTSSEPIEAIYVFPLPQNAAVDDMTMHVGERTIKGTIKKRAEAQKIYENARAAGQTAALLDQERPNIFTQSVANIMPGEKVIIEISYVEVLKYEAGSYEFVFPMVVGPRYIPGSATGTQAGGWAPDTDKVPDASRITPPVAGTHTPSERAGHDISLEVRLDAGVPIQEFRSSTHQIFSDRTGPNSAVVKLRELTTIPNKDFILKYDVAGAQIEDALLTHRKDGKGFFTFILQPPDRVPAEGTTPKELVFVLDTSGSMSGFPIEKAKEVILGGLAGLYPNDTFNVITFAGDTQILFPEPVPATAANVKRAKDFIEGRQGGGGTEMMKAIRAALDPSDSQEHVRIVCFLTDGYVGDDMTIVGEVQRHPNARVFSFGIGSSVNRFLLDKMAEVSRGEVEYVGLNDDGSAAAKRFYERVRTPLLTDLEIDWGGLAVTDIQPQQLMDLFDAKPVVVTGRYTKAGSGTIRLRGKRAGESFVREIKVDLPADEAAHDVLASLWARRKVDQLMAKDWKGIQEGTTRPDVEKEITDLGLEYRLMTQFTSFVAVEERVVNEGGKQKTIQVPVELPEGVSREGVFGEKDEWAVVGYEASATRNVSGLFYASPGVVGGVGGGVYKAQAAPSPAPPPAGRGTIQVVTKAGSEDETAERRTDKKRELLASKLHGDVIELWDCWKSHATNTGQARCKNLTNGMVQVQITLTSASQATMDRLLALGFQPDGSAQKKVVRGRLPIERLEEVADLATVQYIALVN